MKLPNTQIKKILYATDLSETAVHAFSYAVSLANMYGAGITILHVLAEFPAEKFIIEHDQYQHMERDQNATLFRSEG
jgi:nucleotide-binding universal stress UspA family protein